MLAARQPFGEWAQAHHARSTTSSRPTRRSRCCIDGEELRRRQVAVGFTLEELELILHPMVEDAQEAVGSMGDDTPHRGAVGAAIAACTITSGRTFSQVTNPPIDSLRETRVMTLKTRLGNLGNVLDEDSSQCDLLQLESPVLSTAEFQAMRAFMGASACVVDCTLPGRRRRGRAARRAGTHPPRSRGRRARRLHPCDPDRRDMSARTRAPIPMILATGGVHTHLVRQSLRTFTSLNVRCAECLDVHYFAVLIGVGATTVNAYLAQECIADRHRARPVRRA